MYETEHGYDLVELFRAEFQLCRLKAGDTAAILSGASQPGLPGPWRYRQEYVKAAFRAFDSLGIAAFHLELPPFLRPILPISSTSVGKHLSAGVGGTGLKELRPALGALKQVDFVFDLAMTLFSPELAEMVGANAKVLICFEPPEPLFRLFPSQDLKRRVLNAKRRMDKGRTRKFRVTSPAGTDLAMEIGQYGACIECGFADDPGRWDFFPSGQTFCFANDGTGDGQFVLDRGDQVILPYLHYIEEPVKLVVEKGYIREITGGSDARLISDNMRSWIDPEVYALGHQSIGLHPQARWDAAAVYGWDSPSMDARIFHGCYLIGTGPNTLGGGKRDTPCHFDIALRNCSLEIDGERILEQGRVIPDDLRAESN
jgi:2,5-dihydroxypyridine 5,6-dioxygenase